MPPIQVGSGGLAHAIDVRMTIRLRRSQTSQIERFIAALVLYRKGGSLSNRRIGLLPKVLDRAGRAVARLMRWTSRTEFVTEL